MLKILQARLQQYVKCEIPDVQAGFRKGRGSRDYGLLFPYLLEFSKIKMIHTVKGMGIVNEAEIDVFLELSCFFDDPVDVGNLILCIFYIQLEYLQVHGSYTVEAWLGEFRALLY